MTRAATDFLFGPIMDVRGHGALIGELTRKGVSESVRGPILGPFWLALRPALLLTIYTLAFGFVLERRWPGHSDDLRAFAVILFCGLGAFHVFSDIVNGASRVVVQSKSFVTKVAFPAESVVYAHWAARWPSLLVTLAIIVAARWIVFGAPTATALLAPLALAPLAIWALGLSFILGALGPYMRDIEKFSAVLMTGVLFLSAIFYPPELLAAKFPALAWANPVLVSLDALRDVLLFDGIPDWRPLAAHAGAGLGAVLLGRALFRTLKPGFADVL